MPSSSKAIYRCQCVSGGCYAHVDAHTGEMGRLLTAAQLAAHERWDRTQSAAKDLSAIQSELLRRNEAQMAASTPAKASSTSRTPSPTAQSYRIEAETRTLRDISVLRDQIDDIAHTIQSRSPVAESSSNDQLKRRYDELKPVLEQLGSFSTDLAATIRPVPRGWDSAQRMFVETNGKLETLLQSLNHELKFCESVRNAREIRAKLAKEAQPGYYETDHHFLPLLANVHPLLQLVHFMMVVCSALFGLSQRGCKWLLSMTAYIIQIAATYAYPSSELPHTLRSILADFITRPDTITNQFRLEAKHTVLATCPNAKCRKTHKPTVVDGVLSYRRRCDGHLYNTKGKRSCRRQLVRPKTVNGKELAVPILPFIAFDMKDWVASLTTRPGLETEMDQAWDTLGSNAPDMLWDAFDGSAIRDLRGPDGKPFGDGGEEARYLFTLSVDWFNPLGNRIAGKSVSVGGMALVCLNIPIQHRYKPENMFLAGIIPGPRETHYEACNPFIRPLVDDLLDFWKPGVFFSQTLAHPKGRRVRCALIALVCDTPAARKFAGFLSHSARKFCSRCDCDSLAGDLNNYDPATWTLRTNEECRHQGQQYLAARTSRDRDDLANWNGRRWSELERLPYFDITRHVVVDPMHNLLLGLLKEHFRNILGFRPRNKVQKQAFQRRTPAPVVDIDVERPALSTQGAVDSWNRLISWISAPMNYFLDEEETSEYDAAFKRFGRQNKEALVKLCKALNIPVEEEWSKKLIVEAIFHWRLTLDEDEAEDPTLQDYDTVYTSENMGDAFTASEITEILNDIENMVRPSWLTKPPVLSRGKLKADDWRSLCTTIFPISLVRLWADKTDEHHTILLEMTLCLISAVVIACSRSTSQLHADNYTKYMYRYRELLHSRFPDLVAKPNFHFAFHIPEFLMLFGPVHGWWTFPFERLWGTLQDVSTNYIPGLYERTIGEGFYHSAKLRSIFKSSTCPQPIEECQSMFDSVVQPVIRDTHLTDAIMLPQPQPSQIRKSNGGKLSQPLLDAFRRLKATQRSDIEIPQVVFHRRYLTVAGIRYATRTLHRGNSSILLPSSVDANHKIPAHIEYILETPDGRQFLAVSLHRPLDAWAVQHDPFRKYTALGIQMWSSHIDLKELYIVNPSVLEDSTHFASWDMPWTINGQRLDVSVLMPLSRHHMFTADDDDDAYDIDGSSPMDI